MIYKIKNHKLEGVTYQRSPNQGENIEKNLRYLLIHYTGGRSFQQTVDYLCKKSAKASAHLVLGREGEITQLVPFSKKTWNAGASSWNGLEGLNDYTISIELDNYGLLTKKPDGTYRTYFGRTVSKKEVFIGAHKNSPNIVRAWHEYTEAQIDKLEEIAPVIYEKYELEDILGHDDVAPKRKNDPGPAFCMENFRSLILGRENEVIDNSYEKYYDEERGMCVLPDYVLDKENIFY
jgi:N-acetylmuramoyl-L-alanine amidase